MLQLREAGSAAHCQHLVFIYHEGDLALGHIEDGAAAARALALMAGTEIGPTGIGHTLSVGMCP